MIVELRQYTLHPGRRDVLIDLFTQKLIIPQEDAGMRILGTFRDLDNPDKFVWLRGFASMQSRLDALQTFYFGPVWLEHRDAANATMIDSDDVLLLRSADDVQPIAEPITVTICYYDRPADRRLSDVAALVRLETEPSENTFPQLPVRAGENVIVLLSRGDVELPADSATRVERLRLIPTTLAAQTPAGTPHNR